MNDKLKIAAIIPARGGSKRLNKKNIFPVLGKPMLYYSILACNNSKYSVSVYVSTEDEEIAEVAKQFGAIIHNRSHQNAGDKVYKQVAIREAADHIKKINGDHDIYLSLQANSPTITSEDIDKCIDALIQYNRDEIISVDQNLMQDAAIRVFKGDYVFQKDLSTNCGVVITNLHDVHNREDVIIAEKILKDRNIT